MSTAPGGSSSLRSGLGDGNSDLLAVRRRCQPLHRCASTSSSASVFIAFPVKSLHAVKIGLFSSPILISFPLKVHQPNQRKRNGPNSSNRASHFQNHTRVLIHFRFGETLHHLPRRVLQRLTKHEGQHDSAEVFFHLMTLSRRQGRKVSPLVGCGH